MVSRPAAAAVRERGESALDDRLRWLLARADRAGGSRLAARLLPAASALPDERCQGNTRPPGFYWLWLAEWLAGSLGLDARPGGRALLDDLCWIQYCVYGLFRVQDDLVDGDAADPLLAVEANRLAAEAAAVAARRFEGDSPFWEVFRDAIDRTSRAILALDDLQRAPRREPHADLGLYVDLAAGLKIAAAGVAIAAGRQSDWRRRISPALDRLAVAAQVLDDVEDVDDDLAAGRVNYAAWYLSRPLDGAGAPGVRAVVAFSLATGDRLAGLFDVARRHVEAAAEALGPAVCPAAHRFLGLYRDRIDALETRIERDRRALLAGD